VRSVVSLFHDLFEVDSGGHDIPTEALGAPPWVIASALSCGPTTPSGSWICWAADNIGRGRRTWKDKWREKSAGNGRHERIGGGGHRAEQVEVEESTTGHIGRGRRCWICRKVAKCGENGAKSKQNAGMGEILSVIFALFSQNAVSLRRRPAKGRARMRRPETAAEVLENQKAWASRLRSKCPKHRRHTRCEQGPCTGRLQIGRQEIERKRGLKY